MDEEREYCMLTTYDNPINPFVDFTGWFKMDHVLGHDCCELLDRESFTSDLNGDEENLKELERAINFIVNREPLIYRKVYPSDFQVKAVAY